MQPPTIAQLAELAFASLVNARGLFEDARILRSSGRLPSAFVLLGLSADEIGKHILVTALPSRGLSNAEWKKFWKRFNSHEAKLGNTLYFDWWLEPLDVGPPPLGKDLHLRRLDATYVDFREGQVQQPSEQISASAVDAAYNMVERQLEFCEQLTTSTTVKGLAQTMERVNSEVGQAPTGAKAYERAALDLISRLGITPEDLDAMMDAAPKVLGERDEIIRKPQGRANRPG